MPQLPPWLALLALLLLRPNRSAQAWWIWAPVLCVVVLEALVRAVLSFLPSQTSDIFFQIVYALTFGVAALWLLAPFLGNKYRFVTFLGMFVVLAGFSALTFLFAKGFSGERMDTGPLALLVGAHTLVQAAALSLAGLICRRHYSPLRLTLWLVVFLASCTLILTLPFFILSWIQSHGELPVLELFAAVLIVSGICLSALLPFLVLAFVSAVYRERLKDLLLLGRIAPPPTLPPPPAPAQPAPQTAPNPPGPHAP